MVDSGPRHGVGPVVPEDHHAGFVGSPSAARACPCRAGRGGATLTSSNTDRHLGSWWVAPLRAVWQSTGAPSWVSPRRHHHCLSSRVPSPVGTPLEPRNVSRDFRALCRKHGFRRVRLHDMRHTCVTLVLSLGVHPRVVMEIVGHSAMDMTMNVYAHVSLDVPRQALDVLNAELDRESPEE
jgi:integrase